MVLMLKDNQHFFLLGNCPEGFQYSLTDSEKKTAERVFHSNNEIPILYYNEIKKAR